MSIIIFVALITWHTILLRVPTGEGYYYFSKPYNIGFKDLSIKSILGSYDFFAISIFYILIRIFRDNIFYYMYFQFFVMITVYITFYFVLVKIFKDKIQSLLSTIFFISNYVGQFTMIGEGDYQRFIQRVPNLIPIFLSILFMVFYIRNKKLKYLIYSFLLYLTALIMYHYTSFFIPLFVILPLVYFITNQLNIKKAVTSAGLFVITTILITSTDPLSKPAGYSMLQFIQKTPRLIEMILYQVSISGFPIQFTVFIAKHHVPPFETPYTFLLFPIFILVTIFLFLGYLKLRKNKNTLAIYTTAVLSLFPISFLTMYAYNAIPNPLINFGEDRIYFIHSILFAIIWGIIVKAFLKTKNSFKSLLAISSIAFLFLFQNLSYINKDLENIALQSNRTSNFLNTMKSISGKLNKKTLIIAPWQLLVTEFIYENLYNIPKKNFVTLDNTTQSKIMNISYDPNNTFVFNLREDKILDETQNFKNTKKLIITN